MDAELQSKELPRKLTRHIARVERLYSVAVENITFYPEEERAKILALVEKEYQSFQQVVQARREGTSVSQVSASAHLWLNGSIPKNLKAYAHANLTQKEQGERNAFARKQIETCTMIHANALDTVSDLNANGYEVDVSEKELENSFNAFVTMMKLHKKSFSIKNIQLITGKHIQNYLDPKSFPEKLTKYGGHGLSLAETQARRKQVAELEVKAREAFEILAKREDFGSNQETIGKSLKQLDLVIRLYLRGLTLNSISDLTGVRAHFWISDCTLPAPLAKALPNKLPKTYTMPSQFGSDAAYVIGAYFAQTKLFRSQRIRFDSKSEEPYNRLQASLQSAFGIEINSFQETAGKASITMKEFLREFHEKLEIDSDDNPVVPYSVFESDTTARAFIEGYFEFSSIYLKPADPKFSISSVKQDRVLKSLAVALSFFDVYAEVATHSSRSSLMICDAYNLERLTEQFSNFGTQEEVAELKERVAKRRKLQLESYDDYLRIRKYLDTLGKQKINYGELLTESGVDLDIDYLSQGTKKRIQQWKSGKVPIVAAKAEAAQGYFKELYPEHANAG